MSKQESPVRLLYDKVLITADKMKSNKTDNGIIIPESEQTTLYFAEQTVVAVGVTVDPEWLKPGDKVFLNVENFKIPKLDKSNPDNYMETMQYRLPIEIINDKEYMYVSLRDIKYILN
jgi:co-chaperonin GroES (HSP10)